MCCNKSRIDNFHIRSVLLFHFYDAGGRRGSKVAGEQIPRRLPANVEGQFRFVACGTGFELPSGPYPVPNRKYILFPD